MKQGHNLFHRRSQEATRVALTIVTMMRMVLFLLLTTLFLPPAAGAGELPAQLKETAMIQGDMVKLGDLWDNLGRSKSDILLAPAPQLGKRVTADAKWLEAVALKYGIDWHPGSAFDKIVIERVSHTVEIRDIEGKIKEALAQEGVPPPFEFEISNRSALSIIVAGSGPAGIAVRDTNWDEKSGNFTLTLEIPAGAPDALRQRVNGRVYTTSRIPVLTRALNRGEIIRERDVEWLEIRDDRNRRDVLTDLNRIIGQEARIALRQGASLRSSDLQRPILVPRNSIVTLSLKTPYMTLTTQGRAVEDGSMGDTIRVTNLQTKRTVEAVVEGPGRVVVEGSTPPLGQPNDKGR